MKAKVQVVYVLQQFMQASVLHFNCSRGFARGFEDTLERGHAGSRGGHHCNFLEIQEARNRENICLGNEVGNRSTRNRSIFRRFLKVNVG